MSKTLNDAWQHYASVKDQSHGTAHIQSVLNNAMELSKHYPNVNKRDVEYAAILHDIGHQAQTGASGYHPIIGVGIAAKYLKDFPVESQTAILDAVRHHHGEELPHTDVGRIVRDADRLASTENPATLANRAFLYRVNKSPNQDVDTTARSAYKYLRTTKLNRLIGRANNAFLTEEGRQMFDNNVKNINDATSSYEKFTKLLDVKGVNPVYREVKTASIKSTLNSYVKNIKGRKGQLYRVGREKELYTELSKETFAIGSKYNNTKDKMMEYAKNYSDRAGRFEKLENDINSQVTKARLGTAGVLTAGGLAGAYAYNKTASIVDRYEKAKDWIRPDELTDMELKNAKRAPIGSAGTSIFAKSTFESAAPRYLAMKKDELDEAADAASKGFKKYEESSLRAADSYQGMYDRNIAEAKKFDTGSIRKYKNDFRKAHKHADDVYKTFRNRKVKVGLGIAGLAGVGMYALSKDKMKTAGILDYTATVHKDDEDKTSRNVDLGVAGLGLLGTSAVSAKGVNPMYKKEGLIDTLEKEASSWKRHFGTLSELSKNKLIRSGVLNHEKELAGLNVGSENIINRLGARTIEWGKDGKEVINEALKNYNSTKAGRYQQGKRLMGKGQFARSIKFVSKPSAGWVTMGPTHSHPGFVSKGNKLPSIISVNKDVNSLDHRYAKGVVFRHEADELRTAYATRANKKTNMVIGDDVKGITNTPQSHMAPSVIARESANVAIAPTDVRETFTRLRAPERIHNTMIGHTLNYGKEALPDAKAMKAMNETQARINSPGALDIKRQTEEAMRTLPEPKPARELDMRKALIGGGAGLAAVGAGSMLYGNLATNNKGKTKTAGIKDRIINYAKNVKGRSSEIRNLKYDAAALRDSAQQAYGKSSALEKIDRAASKAESNKYVSLIDESIIAKHKAGALEQAVENARYNTAHAVLLGTGLGTLAYKDMKGKTKTAGTLDYLASVKKNDNATTVTVRHDNNIFQDAKNAYNDFGKNDGFRNERLKVLAGTAAAALGASVMLYTALKGSPELVRAGKAAIKTPFMEKAVRRVGPVLTLGGLYGAYVHKDDKDTTARNIALGIAGAGLATSATVGGRLAGKAISDATLKQYGPTVAAGTGLIGAGLLASTHAAQKIEDEGKIDNYLRSKEPLIDITRHVNAIREKKNLASRYPLARVFNTVPVAENLPNMVVGTPAEELSPLDKALYKKYQQEN